MALQYLSILNWCSNLSAECSYAANKAGGNLEFVTCISKVCDVEIMFFDRLER